MIGADGVTRSGRRSPRDRREGRHSLAWIRSDVAADAEAPGGRAAGYGSVSVTQSFWPVRPRVSSRSDPGSPSPLSGMRPASSSRSTSVRNLMLFVWE